MKPGPPVTRSLTALDGAICLVAIQLVVQMWLLTSTLEAYLAGHGEVAVPAAALSAFMFAASFGLFRSIVSIDRRRVSAPDHRRTG